MSSAKSKTMQRRAHELIPGGCHTYAKGDDQFPENAPAFIVRGKGCHVWDMEDNEFIEYGMGLRAVTLGHAYEPVVQAAYEQMLLGNNFTRPATIEVEYAEELLSEVTYADQVKFAKDGSAVTTAAIKLARAYTGREMVAYCSDHPFFSYNDWFIGTTAVSGGIPASEYKNSLGFHYNDPESLDNLLKKHGGQIACVIMEPEKDKPPQDGFLEEVRRLCTEHGVVLIFDEMITGFRWAIGGASSIYGVEPDLSTFGKAIANGFALSALLGKREIMDLGGIKHDKERVFLLSTTHGAENHAIAAARATLEVYRSNDVIGHLARQGQFIKDQLTGIVTAMGLSENILVLGRPECLVFATLDENGDSSQPYRTLLLQELVKRGIIAPSLIVSYSHTDEDVANTLAAFEESLAVYKDALQNGVDKYLVGQSVKPVYRRFN